MPTVRYQIRGEYGLADPELYREADKEDPEALLEGVAMAGLVGVLRQLGDLAQFAAEIFHDLHEEVMATASRGHGLMLRVQQLEAEFPSIERAFLAQTNPARFAYNAGIDWHANLQVDQNLVTRGDMPRFILDSYEDCRGPPRLFMLDKFDVAGAGACLKRYSDPSSFKVELAASGKMEPEVQRDNKARKVKKRGSRWRNGEAAESFLAPRIDSNLQTITSAKVPTRRVKLKNRNLTDSDITSRRSYLEHLIEANTPEQTVLLENSISNSNTIIQSTNSSESAPQVREIMIDNASDSPKVKEGTPVQSPTKQEEALSPLNESGYQKLDVEEISERVPELSDDVQKSYRTSYIVEQKVVLANLDKKTEACLDDYRSSEAEENLLASKEVDQKKSFPDTNLITEGGNDDYRSEDIGSELDNYMDALNTMELEIETDTESRAKSDPGFSNMEYQQIVSDINENQQDLTASSELNSVDNFTAPLGLNGVLKNGISSPPNSNSSGSLRDAQPPQGNMSNSEMPSNPEIGLWEIHDKPSQRNGEAVQLVSLAHLHTSEIYDTKESDIASLKSETGVTSSYSYSPMDVHSQGTNELRSVSIQPNDSPRHIHSQGSDKVQTVSIQPNELYSTYVEGTHEVAELSDGKILQMENMRIENIFELPSGTHDTMEEQSSLDSNSDFSDGLLNLSDVEGSGSEYAKDQIPDDRGETFEIPDHLSEPKEEFFLEEAPKLYVEGSLPTLTVDIKGDGKESTEQETKDSSGGSTSLKTSAFSPKVISTVMQPKDVVVDIDAVEQREDLAKDISDYVIDTHEVAEPLDSELPCHVEITELLSQANDDKAFPRRPEDSCISSDSPLIALDTPENLHSKEDDAKQITENMADTLGDRVLEGVATEHVEETPTSFTVEVGDAEESMGQYKVEDTSSANSGVLVEASPIVMQSDGILIEMENSVAPSEGIAYSELVAGNANEAEEGKFLMRNEVTRELEHFSDVVIQEPWSVEFVEPLPLPSGDEIIPDDKQLHSEEPAWVVIDRSEAVGENMELPSEFTVSSLHEDSAPCEKLPYDDNSLTENVTVKADVSNHDPCPVYSSEVSGFVQELLEDCVPDDAVLGQHKQEISEVSSPKDTTSLYSESNLCMAVLPQIEDQPISSPVSSSELTDSSDSKLPPGISQMFSAEHSQRDFCPNVYEENPISSPESEDPGCAEGMSPPSTCLLREPAVPLVEASVLKIGNQQNEACSHQKVDNLESNGLQSEIAYTDEGNNIQSKSEDLHDKPSDQGPEPDNGCMDDSCTPPSTCQLVESSTSVEEASKSEAADEPSTVSSNQEGDLLQASNLQSGRTYFDGQKSIQSNSDSYDDKPLEPGAEPDCGNVIESDTPPSSTHNPEELKPEPLVPPGCISDLSVDSLASCISTPVLSPNASSDLAIAKTSPQDPSQQQLGESISSFQIQDVDETPPPPPLPPLQWRTGKLWLGASTSGGNAVQPPSGTNPFMSPASIDEKHSQESVPDGREVLPADIFAPLSVWEDERFQHGSFASEGTIDHPRSLSNLPPIVEGERYQHGTLFVEADMTHSSDPLLGVSNSPPIEDEKHSCCGDAPAPPLQILTSTHSHLPEEDQVQAVQGGRPQLGLLVQSLELQRSQHEASVVERAPVLPLNPFLVTSPMEDWQHQYGYGVYGGESVQRLNLSAPLLIAGATIPQYGFMYPTGENPSTFYDIMVPTVEGERPKWKHRSIRDRPRDPLIEAVAAHDKSTLRKVSELDKPPAKSKFEERDTLLEQIRKKSFSLKPAGVTKPNIKGPSTNLKVSAILEKANAIRQAFAGSDEDDDGDSWSDS